MNIITIDNFTKDYKNNKGVFDVSIKIKKGEVYGYLGPNGAGKSTTLRHLMGFSKPDKGILTIDGKDCFKDKEEIKKIVGYLPGEISLPEDMSGIEYLKLIFKMRKLDNFDVVLDLLKYFEINPDIKIKKMSKGMKQKIAIVSAFMHNPQILLLDEPTTGLDPLMQKKFIKLIAKEKANGKTIILSSHIFDEVSKICDRVGIIKNGQLIDEVILDDIRHTENKKYKIELKNIKDFNKLKKLYPTALYRTNKKQLIISIKDSDINELLLNLSKCNLLFLKEEKQTLEQYFMKFYGDDEND